MVRELVGCDIDLHVLARNRDVSRRVRADLATLDLPEDSFDVVMTFDVVEHLERPEAFIQRTFRLLKKGGHLFIVTPNKSSLFGVAAHLLPLRWKRVCLALLGTRTNNEVHWYRLNTPTALARCLSREGFRDIEITLLNRLPSLPRMRLALMGYFHLCKLPLFRNLSVGLLCTATKP